MNNQVEITDLDTDLTLLYKYASIYNIPTKYIIVETPESDKLYEKDYVPTVKEILQTYKYRSLFEIIENKKPGESLIDIQEELNIPIKSELALDIPYIYYTVKIVQFKDIMYNIVLSTLNDMRNNPSKYNKTSIIYKGLEFDYNYVVERKNLNLDDLIGITTELSNIENINEKTKQVLINLQTISQNILTLINDHRVYNLLEPIDNFIPITDGYDDWRESFVKTINIENNILNNMLRNNIYISKKIDVSDIVVSDIDYKNFVRAGKGMMEYIGYNGNTLHKEPTNQDITYIFNNLARVSLDVPYIQINKNGQSLYKIYNNKMNDVLDYKIIVPDASKTKNDNSIYIVVWTGYGNPLKAKKDHRKLIKYDINNNKIIIPSEVKKYDVDGKPLTEDELILNRIENAFKNKIKFTYNEEIRVGAEFKIYGLDYDSISFSSYLMLNPLINSYIYIDESNTIVALKQRLYYHLKSLIGIQGNESNDKSTAWISINKHNIQSRTIISSPSVLSDSNYQTYLSINVVRAKSRTIVKQLQYIIPKFLKMYNLDKERHEARLPLIVPGIEEYVPDKEHGTTEVQSQQTNIKQLEKAAPDLFIKYYARICQCKEQPIIIDSSQVPEWTSKTFINKGRVYPRQVMPFPPSNPKWIFVCPSDIWSFPGVKENKLANSNIYPFVPCCFKKDQRIVNPTDEGKIIYRNMIEKTSTTNKYNYKTNKKLDRGRIGEVPDNIKLLLKYKYNNHRITRNGSIYSKSSLLHCIYDALVDKKYNSLQNDLYRENFIVKVRQMLTQYLYNQESNYISLLDQELYDLNDQEIIDNINNPDVFLDPALYYRAVEEIFDINIYVFTTTANDKTMLELPRHKKFHARTLRTDRKTIIIYKHWGTESDKLKYPHCEYISVINNFNGYETKIFDLHNVSEDVGNISKFLHTTITETNKILMWSIDNRNYQPAARVNVFSSIDIKNVFKSYLDNIKYQYIDNYGKMRGLVLDIESKFISVFLPPLQPEKYQSLTAPLPQNTLPDIRLVLSLFGIIPQFITVNDDNILTGLWFPILDIDEGIYIPIDKTYKLDQLPEDLLYISELPYGSTFNFFTQGIDHVKRYKKLLLSRRIILELVRWVYILYKYNNPHYSLDDFYARYFTQSTRDYSGIDSANIYNFYNLSNILPQEINTPDQAIDYIINLGDTGLIENRKLVAYSKKFTDDIKYFLDRHEYSIKGLDIVKDGSKGYKEKDYITIPKEINKMYMDEHDYIYNEDTLLFIGESSMKTWLYNKVHLGVKVSEIKSKLDSTYTSMTDPYLYKNENDNIFLIQNVYEGDFYKAINISYNWHIKSKNPGYHTKPYNISKAQSIPPHVIYTINNSGHFIISVDKREGNDEYLKLLAYSSSGSIFSQYAAVLTMV